MDNTNIVTSMAYPNFSGLLYNRANTSTPFLNMISGKTVFTNSIEFVIGQSYSTEEGEIPNISETASLTAPKATSVKRNGQMTNVTQIFQEVFGVSDVKKANMGTLSGVNLAGQVANPINEEDFQTANKMAKIKRSIEKTFIQGTYHKATDDSDANTTRGMIEAIVTNVIEATDETLDLWLVNEAVQKIKDNKGEITNLILFMNSTNLLQLHGNAVEMGVPVGTAYMSAYGIQLTDLILPVGTTVHLAIGEFIPEGTVLVVNPDVVRPVEQPVPGKGNFYRELLAKEGAGDRYMITGLIGLDHGPEWMHAKITGLSTTFTKPVGKKIVVAEASADATAVSTQSTKSTKATA